MTPDVNVLVAASRSDHPHHAPARHWLQQALSAAGKGSVISLQPMVVASFLRLITHARIFVNPTPIGEALGFLDALLSAPGVLQPTLGAEWPHFRRLCVEKSLRANDLPGAWLAAAVLQQSEHLVSFDADFRRLLPASQFTRLAA